MKSFKTVYSKGRKRKAWNIRARKNFSNKRREHLSETNKGSYHNQGEWLEVYESSGLYLLLRF